MALVNSFFALAMDLSRALSLFALAALASCFRARSRCFRPARKAIGAYNYALEINPNFHQATEYRGEAFLALGMYERTKQSYMQLFRNERELADQLMITFDSWVEEKNGSLEGAEVEFAAWVAERKRMAKITTDLSKNNTRSW